MATGDPADGPFDVQDLEHQLQPRAAQVGDLLQQPGRHRPARLQGIQDGTDVVAGWEGGGGEPFPDGAVLGPAQQHHLGPVQGAAGPADLLVVGDWGVRRLEMDHKGQVGLVKAHTQR